MAKESLIYNDPSVIYNWVFNDNDSVVNNRYVKATKNGNPTFKDGIATFNGTTDYYKLKTLINLGTKYSIEIKFKVNSLPVSSSNIVLCNDFGTYYALNIYNNTTIYSELNGILTTTTWVGDNNWHTFCITRNNTSQSIYLDGILTSTTSVSSLPIILTSIGASGYGFYKFNGSIDYIRIWNRQLSASEVANNYKGKTFRSLPYSSNEVLGSELVVNGGFDTDSNWTKSGAVTISNGTTNFNGNGNMSEGGIKAGLTYKTTFTITLYTSGSIKLCTEGDTNGTLRNAIGTYTEYIVATVNGGLFVITGGAVLSVDNVSFQQVTSSIHIPLFHINSDNGVIRDLTGLTTPIATNVALPKLGSGISVMKFNGSSGNITLPTQIITGDLSFFTWVNLRTLGEGSSNNYGMIFSNGQFNIWLNDSTNRIAVTRNNSTTIYSSNSITKFGNWICLFITSNAAGITNIYVGDRINPLIIVGTNLSAGSLTDTTRVSTIGQIVGADTRTLNGSLNDTIMFQGLLTIDEGQQIQSSSKIKYL